MGWTLLIKSITDMVGGFFNWRTSSTDNQAVHEVIDDKRDCEEACKYAELAIRTAERFASFTRNKYSNRFKKYVDKFRELK